ncbi:MAG: hypothetical protein LBV30_00600, partial [Propionibacteriaceae bacterium]|nr:hypothetical protein [Propionibacteriaceae bacterium]
LRRGTSPDQRWWRRWSTSADLTEAQHSDPTIRLLTDEASGQDEQTPGGHEFSSGRSAGDTDTDRPPTT